MGDYCLDISIYPASNVIIRPIPIITHVSISVIVSISRAELLLVFKYLRRTSLIF